MDVQQTSDKKLVIHHDFVIDWHTDMRGQIYDMTEGELKALDFGSWKDVDVYKRQTWGRAAVAGVAAVLAFTMWRSEIGRAHV